MFHYNYLLHDNIVNILLLNNFFSIWYDYIQNIFKSVSAFVLIVCFEIFVFLKSKKKMYKQYKQYVVLRL